MRGLMGMLVLLAACASTSEVEKLREDNRLLSDRVERLEKKLENSDRAARGGRPDPDKVYKVPVGNSPSLGAADAPVTIVEFADFQCPFCDRVRPTLKQIQEKYGTKVRLVWKHNPLPFHTAAMPAALASDCAHQQNLFWPMHDAIYASIRDEDGLDLDRSAADIGLDAEKLRACREGPDSGVRVRADMKLAEELGARGTPSFFINGRPLMGAQPYEAFTAIIDEELRKAEKPRR
jgi:protein-disulfide isomerase